MGFDAGSITATLELKRGQFDQELNAARRDAADFAKQTYTATLDAARGPFTLALDAAEARLSEFARINAESHVSVAGVETAVASVDELHSRLSALGSVSVKVHADVDEALGNLDKVRDKLFELAGFPALVHVEATVTEALAKLDEVLAKAREVGEQHPDVKVDADTGGAVAGLEAARAAAGNADSGFSLFSMSALKVASIVGLLGPALGVAASALADLPALALAGAAAIGTLASAFHGVMDTMKAYGAAQDAAGSGAAQAARQQQQSAAAIVAAQDQVTASGQRLGLAQAQAADAAISSAERVSNAVAGVATAEQNAAASIDSALNQQITAEESLANAQRAEQTAQENLTQARKDAEAQLQSLTFATEDNAFAQRSAQFALTDALAKQQADASKGVSAEQAGKDQLAVEMAQQRIKELEAAGKQLAKQKAEADAAGVDGSKRVVAAQDQVAASVRRTADAQRGVEQAADRVTKAQVDGAASVARAEQSLADARRAQTMQQLTSDASLASARQGVVTAERALAAAQLASTQSSGAAATAAAKYAEALAKLSPNARSAVLAMQDLTAAFHPIQQAVQDAFFEGMAVQIGHVKDLLPILGQGMVGIATALNGMATAFIGVITSAQGMSQINTILQGTAGFFTALTPAVAGFTQNMLTMASVGATSLSGLGDQISRATAGFKTMIDQAAASGQLKAAFDGLNQVVGALLGVLTQLFQIGIQLGAALNGPLAGAFSAIGNLIVALEPTLQALGGAFLSVVTTLANALVPVLNDLSPLITQVAQLLGGVLGQAITIVAPVVGQLAAAALQLIAAVLPLVPPLAQVAAVLGGVLAQAATALVPLVSAIAQVLGQVLTQSLQAIIPIIPTLTSAFVVLVNALTPLIPVLGQIATVIITSIAPILPPLATMFSDLVNALTPLIPPLISLVQSLLPPLSSIISALLPVISALAQSFVDIVSAIVPIIPPMLQIVQSLMPPLNDLIAALAPIVAQLASAFVTVVESLTPLIQPLSQVVLQLVPPLLSLVLSLLPILPTLAQAFVDIVTALVPLIPPLVQIVQALLPPLIGLVKLAIDILTPLAKLIVDIVVVAVQVFVDILVFLIKIVKNVLTGISEFVTAVIGFFSPGGGLSNAIDYFGKFFTDLFNNLPKIVQTVWYEIRKAFVHGVNFVIDIVNGFADAINTVAKALGFDINLHVNPMAEPTAPTGLADGGIIEYQQVIRAAQGTPVTGQLPGYSPGYDTIPAMAGRQPYLLAGGEYIVRPESTRAIGPAGMAAINDAYRQPVAISTDQYLHDGGPIGLAGGGAVYEGLYNIVRGVFPHASLNSGYRAGDPGYHGQGKAADFGEQGSPGGDGRPYLAAINEWIYENYGKSTAELIYDGQGDSRPDIKNGANHVYSAPTPSQHHNHVHWAMEAVPGGPTGGAGGAGIIGGIGNALTSAGNFIVTAMHDLATKLLTPLRAALNSVGDRFGFPGKAVVGEFNKVIDYLFSVADSKDAEATASGGAGPGGPGGPTQPYNGGGAQQWAGVASDVLNELGRGTGELGALLRRIDFESSGNPNAINLTDSNARAGHPSQGLMQVIPSTFAAYAGPYASRAITEPHANIYAGSNYAVHRYGSVAAVDPNVRHQGYDEGGMLPVGLSTVLNATGSPEPVLNPDQWSAILGKIRGGDGAEALPTRIAALLTTATERATSAGAGSGAIAEQVHAATQQANAAVTAAMGQVTDELSQVRELLQRRGAGATVNVTTAGDPTETARSTVLALRLT